MQFSWPEEYTLKIWPISITTTTVPQTRSSILENFEDRGSYWQIPCCWQVFTFKSYRRIFPDAFNRCHRFFRTFRPVQHFPRLPQIKSLPGSISHGVHIFLRLLNLNLLSYVGCIVSPGFRTRTANPSPSSSANQQRLGKMTGSSFGAATSTSSTKTPWPGPRLSFPRLIFSI